MSIVKRALVSVSDRRGLGELCKFLADRGVSIIATSGSKAYLQDEGVESTEVSSVTGFPEILNGRVKTLHPKIHAGILADRNKSDDLASLQKHDIEPIDLVIVNLYDFAGHNSVDTIDIGGPSMIRAAAKNFDNVCVVTDTSDYQVLIDELVNNDMVITHDFKIAMARKAFQLTSRYDAMIASSAMFGGNALNIVALDAMSMRYGENSHQKANFYTQDGQLPFVQLGGKELSYNNILDAYSASNIVGDFLKPTVAIVKHNAPCSVASADNITDAYKRAVAADAISSFGGVVGSNGVVTVDMANEILKLFTEVVIAPDFDHEAIAALRTKVNMRIIKWCGRSGGNIRELRSAFGGVLTQEYNSYVPSNEDVRMVTNIPFDISKYLRDILFSYVVCKHVISNAIVIAKDEVTLGIGCGQPNRVDSARLAMSNIDCTGAVMASDGFFPFPDVVAKAAAAGIACIVQPGGSINDKIVIEEANNLGVPMAFVGVRCFKH